MSNAKPHCLVIGVGKGTGLACVRRFLDEGYAVSMIARNAERLRGFADQHPGSTAYATDITEAEQFRATLQQIVAEQGNPEVVIYNAAMATFKPYTELTTGELETNFRANTSGLLIAAQELAPAMEAAGSGALIVTGNTGALRGTPLFIGFSPTKASQRILAESLARTLGPKGVHVAYVVIDAMIDMPMVRDRNLDKTDDFFAKPDDIANEVYHTVCQPRSTWSFLVQIRPFGENW